jgi:CPA1 family monovalent cation:H+ antiporter
MTFGANVLVRSANRVRPLRVPPLPPAWVTVLGVSGLRGGLTLVLALALPLTTASGAPFPARALLQFLTFVIVVVTLVPISLILPPLLHRLGLTGDGEQAGEEIWARRAAALAAREALGQIADSELDPAGRQGLADYYDAQVRRLDGFLAGDLGGHDMAERRRGVQLQLLMAEHETVERLVRTRQISAAAAERVQRGIYLAAERLMGESSDIMP